MPLLHPKSRPACQHPTAILHQHGYSCLHIIPLQEHDLEAVYKEPPPKLTAARTAVCAVAVVVGAIACLFIFAVLFHHSSMDVGEGAEKVGAGVFLV